jgi:hypothetical protein
MSVVVLDAAVRRERFQEAVDIAEVILESYPNFAHAMVKQGTAYGGLMQKEFVDKYPRPIDIPAALLPRYRLLAERNLSAFAKAEDLGWREE